MVVTIVQKIYMLNSVIDQENVMLYFWTTAFAGNPFGMMTPARRMSVVSKPAF